MTNIFIDGKEGTTGLQIYERLGKRNDVHIITLPEELRKDIKARKECLNSADICFLCLPDEAAKESVSLIENDCVKVIDASTAHRTNKSWVYGLPELSQERRQQIATAKRVANPGCHATGFNVLVAPLIQSKMLNTDYPFVANSITGYSGAGKKTIAVYEGLDRDKALDSPRQYALTQKHKHLPEMVNECGLMYEPIFNPIICDFYCGMCVTVPIFTRLANKKYSVSDIRSFYEEYYQGQNFVKVVKEEDIPAFIPANELSGTNLLKIYVTGNSERVQIASVFDNLGKGASGAAVQNMNIMLGLDETTSLM